jgi:hypothetical protein
VEVGFGFCGVWRSVSNADVLVSRVEGRNGIYVFSKSLCNSVHQRLCILDRFLEKSVLLKSYSETLLVYFTQQRMISTHLMANG